MEENLDPKQFGVTPELFMEWREPRFGNANPQKLKSKVWEWLVHSKLSGYSSAKIVLGAPPRKGGPSWSFDRFGQSVTGLADGRTIYIGGEHEDFYDPEFNIYNDVVVTYPDGAVDFYCYPKSDFPPTDFHSATLLSRTGALAARTVVGEKIILIGALGYKDERLPGYTQLYALDLGTFAIQKLESSGESPGWIHDHQATLSEDKEAIIVTGGKVHLGKGQVLKENIDDWKLTLDSWRWEKLVARNWTQFEIRREDHGQLQLFFIRTALWYLMCNMDEQYQGMMSDLSELVGFQPDVRQIEDLYNFDMKHGALQKDEDAHNVFFFDVDGVEVRFTEELYSLQVVVEGSISEQKESLIKSQLLEKLSALMNSPCMLEEY